MTMSLFDGQLKDDSPIDKRIVDAEAIKEKMRKCTDLASINACAVQCRDTMVALRASNDPLIRVIATHISTLADVRRKSILEGRG